MLYSQELGLRFKALRVHRECHRIYHGIDRILADKFTPKIRLDHYYPWLFTHDFTLEEHTLRSLAIANTLLSDVVHNTIKQHRVAESGQAEAQAHDSIHNLLVGASFKTFESVLVKDELFKAEYARFLKEQFMALETDKELCAGRKLLSAEESERHSSRKSTYLKITLLAMGQLAQRPAKARVLMQAQDQFNFALDCYTGFLNWQFEIMRYPANPFLMMAYRQGCNLTDGAELREAVYEGALCDQVCVRILEACAQAIGLDYESPAFRKVIQGLAECVQKLQYDLKTMKSQKAQ